MIFVYVSLLVIGILFSERLIFPYSGSSYSEATPGLRMLAAADGTALATRYWQAPEASWLIIHFHGNYEDVGQLDPIADELVGRGCSVLAFDYRGYGLSEGRVTEKNSYADAEVVWDEARRLGFDGSRIVIWGRSVGSGPATELALRKNPGALVLESPFVSAFRVSTTIPIFPFDKFRNLSKIGRIDAPLFVFHGENDRIIAPWHSEKLYQKHQGPKQRHLIEGAGHNDVWLHDLDPLFDALDSFLSKHAPTTHPQ